MAIGAEVVRSPGARVDIGALESTSGSAAPIPMNGAQPLIPPSAVKPVAPAPAHPRAGSQPSFPEPVPIVVPLPAIRAFGHLQPGRRGRRTREWGTLTPYLCPRWG